MINTTSSSQLFLSIFDLFWICRPNPPFFALLLIERQTDKPTPVMIKPSADTVNDPNCTSVPHQVSVPLFQSIRLHGRPIRNIDIHAFECLQSLKYLYITHCQLTTAPPIHSLTKTLIVLNLKMNNITYIPSEYFRGFDLLERVVLIHNSITYLPEMYFLNRSLTLLHLDWNRLEDIKPLYFVLFEKLKTLRLEHNFLTNLSFESVMWQVMEYVNLGHNLVSTVNPFRRMTKGKTIINLTNNPFHCNQDLCWMAKCAAKQMGGSINRVLVCSPYPKTEVHYLDLICNSPIERNMTGIFEAGKAKIEISHGHSIPDALCYKMCVCILISPSHRWIHTMQHI